MVEVEYEDYNEKLPLNKFFVCWLYKSPNPQILRIANGQEDEFNNFKTITFSFHEESHYEKVRFEQLMVKYAAFMEYDDQDEYAELDECRQSNFPTEKFWNFFSNIGKKIGKMTSERPIDVENEGIYAEINDFVPTKAEYDDQMEGVKIYAEANPRRQIKNETCDDQKYGEYHSSGNKRSKNSLGSSNSSIENIVPLPKASFMHELENSIAKPRHALNTVSF